MYDYAANGWTKYGDVYIKEIDGQCFAECPGAATDSRVIYPFGGFPKWCVHFGYRTAANVDAEWSAELKRRESLPLLDPDKWEGGDDIGHWYHPAEGGYRLNLDSGGWWHVYECPSRAFNVAREVDLAKRYCENDARERKGLPPL